MARPLPARSTASSRFSRRNLPRRFRSPAEPSRVRVPIQAQPHLQGLAHANLNYYPFIAFDSLKGPSSLEYATGIFLRTFDSCLVLFFAANAQFESPFAYQNQKAASRLPQMLTFRDSPRPLLIAFTARPLPARSTASSRFSRRNLHRRFRSPAEPSRVRVPFGTQKRQPQGCLLVLMHLQGLEPWAH